MRQSAAHFGIPWSRYRLIGAAELAAAAGVMIGLWWHPLGVAAAAGMALLLIGALITHRRAEDGGQGDRTGPARPRDHARLPGHRPHHLGVTRPRSSVTAGQGIPLPVRMNWHCPDEGRPRRGPPPRIVGDERARDPA
jgi:DoxX-like protein